MKPYPQGMPRTHHIAGSFFLGAHRFGGASYGADPGGVTTSHAGFHGPPPLGSAGLQPLHAAADLPRIKHNWIVLGAFIILTFCILLVSDRMTGNVSDV